MSRSKVSERGTDASDQENVLPEVWKQSMEEGEAGEGAFPGAARPGRPVLCASATRTRAGRAERGRPPAPHPVCRGSRDERRPNPSSGHGTRRGDSSSPILQSSMSYRLVSIHQRQTGASLAVLLHSSQLLIVQGHIPLLDRFQLASDRGEGVMPFNAA